MIPDVAPRPEWPPMMRVAVWRLLSAAFVAVVVSAAPAIAQERPKTLLELFFRSPSTAPETDNRPRVTKPQVQPERRQQTRKQPQRRQTAPATASGLLAGEETANLPVEKRLDARVVLVVGDFFASGTAKGLEDAYAQSAGVRVVNAANGDSGLVRDDFYNWPAEIGGHVAQHRPSAIVVMIGANDRQQMMVNGTREAVRSPAWTTEYTARARALAAAIAAQQIPLVWIGQVPNRSAATSADMSALNDIYRQAATNARANASFVDVWEGFVDENGKFMERGPDINGQTVQLRTGQINVTRAGYRKIAFYAERSLARILGNALAPNQAINAAGAGGLALPPLMDLPPLARSLASAEANRLRLVPVDLKQPDAAAGTNLLGETVRPAAPPLSASAPPTGRIDDFKLPVLKP